MALGRTRGYHGPFQVPKTAFFRDFVQKSIIDSYDLADVVRRGTVTAVEPVGDPPHVRFRVRTAEGPAVEAAAVVIAAGPLGGEANFAAFWADLADRDRELARTAGTLVHAADLMWAHAPAATRAAALRPAGSVLVVGGGLTAGHLAVQALTETTAAAGGRVTLCARGRIKERQFDLDLRWMGRQRTHMLCEHFWGLGPAERLRATREAKGGGSITPEVLEQLRGFVARGRFAAMEGAEVASVAWEEGPRGLGYEASLAARDGSWLVTFSTGEVASFDAIWCATGTVLDARRDPLLRGTVEFAAGRADLPNAPTLEGGRTPVLDADLRLVPGLDLFVEGQYAGVQLGPGALNLMGGRAGAARIARALTRRNPALGLCAYPTGGAHELEVEAETVVQAAS